MFILYIFIFVKKVSHYQLFILSAALIALRIALLAILTSEDEASAYLPSANFFVLSAALIALRIVLLAILTSEDEASAYLSSLWYCGDPYSGRSINFLSRLFMSGLGG